MTAEQEAKGMFPPLPCAVRLRKPLDIAPHGIVPPGTIGFILDRCPVTGSLSLEINGHELAVMPFEDDATLSALRVVQEAAVLKWLPIAAELLLKLKLITEVIT